MNLKKILILAGLYVLVLNLKIVMTLGAVILDKWVVMILVRNKEL
jgi:hypothetical protein